MRTRPTISVLAAGAVAVGTFAVAPALAGPVSAAPPGGDGERRAGLDRACERIPDRIERTEGQLARIDGDADARGSLLWFDAKIAEAADNDRQDLADALTVHRDIRAATVPLLEQRLVTLADIAAICADAGS